MGQDFAVVYVKDAREVEYLAELAKYAAKPTQIANWTGKDVAEFARAINGRRLFAAFGNARGLTMPKHQLVCPVCDSVHVVFEPLTLHERIEEALTQPWR